MRRHYMIYTIGLLFLLCGLSSCSEDFLAEDGPELNGLVMQLQIDDNPASVASSRVTADPTLRENVVEHVDVFFSSDGTNIDYYRHATLGTDNRLVLAGADWKDKFPATSYTVYVLANKHDYEDTDNYLSAIKTVDELKQLTDTDAEVNKAEGERSGETTYSGKLFFMDGKTTWTPPTDAIDETIEVELYRAAAKFVVNIGFQSTDEFNLDDISITGVQKKVVNYMPEAMALAEMTPDYETMDAVTGDASGSGMSNTNYTNGKSGEERKDILYAYAYPNAWGDDAERETYLLINAPYSENNEYHNNYYKVPIRISSDANELHIDRNTQYTVNVTIDRKGNEEIDIPVELKPTFNVAEWKTISINVEDDTPNYLVLSDYDIELHNEEEVTIEFFSSSALNNVTVTEAYYIDKNGREQDDQNYYRLGYNGNVQVADSNVPISDLYEVKWDPNTLIGTITFTSQFVNTYFAATDITARYYTLSVTNTDNPNPITRTVEITQYPLEYISGVPGWYSARSDFDATWEDHENETEFQSRPTVSNNFFDSKFYENGTIYTYVARGSGRNGNNPPFTIERGNSQSPQNNNRMYLIQITSTSEDYTVARPKTEFEDGQLITVDDDEENNQLISPAFMLASQLGTADSYGTWSEAKTQCKYYVEVVKYSDGTIHRFDDWRLPTYAELSIIADYQKRQQDVLDEVLRGSNYWTAYRNVNYKVPNSTLQGTTSTRCVRDVSPEDLAEFRAHNIR